MRPAKNSLACAVVVVVLLAMGTAPEGLHEPCTAFAQAPTARAATADFFVSPKGNDRWSGRLADPGENDGPFATAARARPAGKVSTFARTQNRSKRSTQSSRLRYWIGGGSSRSTSAIRDPAQSTLRYRGRPRCRRAPAGHRRA